MNALPDSNIWLALIMEVHEMHEPVKNWFFSIPESGSLYFNRATQQSFLRLLTTSAVWTPYRSSPLTNSSAWRIYQDLFSRPQIGFLGEENGVEDQWRRYGVRTTASPKLWMDAYLAAFAVAADLVLVTTDKAFKKYKGCTVELIG